MAYLLVDKKILVILKHTIGTAEYSSSVHIVALLVCFNMHIRKSVLWRLFPIAGCNPVGITSRVAPSGSIPSASTNYVVLLVRSQLVVKTKNQLQ
jgi:hypothetical protein